MFDLFALFDVILNLLYTIGMGKSFAKWYEKRKLRKEEAKDKRTNPPN